MENTATSLGFLETYQLFKRRYKLLFSALIVGLALAAIFVAVVQPKYTATALILVDPSAKNLLNENEAFLPGTAATNALIESEVEILRTDSMLLSVIRSSGLMTDAEFGPRLPFWTKFQQSIGIRSSIEESGEDLLSETLDRFRDAVDIRRRGLTYLISLSVTSESPRQAAQLANVYAETYIERQLNTKVEASLSARDALQLLVEDAKDNLAQSQDSLTNYIDRNLERLAKESGSDEIFALRDALIGASSETRLLESRLEQSRAALQAQDWEGLSEILASEAISSLQTQRLIIVSQLSEQEEGSANEINIRAELERFEQELEREVQSAINLVEEDRLRFLREEDIARADIQELLLSSELSAETLSEIYEIRQESTIARQQYDTLLRRTRSLEAQASVEVADSTLVSRALAPSKPSFPRATPLFAIAAVLSLSVGMIVAFLSEFYFGGVSSIQQLENLLPSKVAAAAPRIEQEANQKSVADNVFIKPLSPFSESLRQLRAVIERDLNVNSDGASTIMISSSVSAEGKSSIALSLARTYANAGARTLLIDADMRKPMQATLQGAKSKDGLFEFLSSESETKELNTIVDAFSDNLHVVLGGQHANVPTDQLLQTARFRELIRQAKIDFDRIIIDTPPLVPVVDAQMIGEFADCSILCVRNGSTSQSMVRMSYERLKDSNGSDGQIYSLLNFHEISSGYYNYFNYG